MTRIDIFTDDADEIGKISDAFGTTDAFVVEALLDYVRHESTLLNYTVFEILEDYLG